MRRRCLQLALLPLLLLVALVVGAAQPFADSSAATQAVAEPYFEAYVARDWTRLEPFLAEAGSFADPTAEPVFGKVESLGKAQVMKTFTEGYASIKHMRFNKTRAFFSGAFAVFEGTLDWTLALPDGREVVTEGMPFMSILRVQDGQIQEHRDYADYQPFIAGHRKAMAGS